MRDLMTSLARPVLRRLGRDDRGGVGLIVAILLGGGVLLGMGALVIDVGQIYQNRAELQNGADAGALAVAKSCALGSCDGTTATSQATGNASALTGHQASVVLVCGTGLGTCPASTGTSITNCPANPPAGTNFVDVRTATKTSSGSLLPAVFGKAVVGSKNYNGTEVFACAQAEWGPALAGSSLGVVLSYCDWQSLAGSGRYDVPLAVYLKGDEKDCSGPAGQDVPGGFGWLDTGSNDCTASINLTADTADSNTGNDVSGPCKQVLVDDSDQYAAGNPQTVYIPIYDSTSGTGNNCKYHVIGLASFVITGYANLPGAGNSGPKDYGDHGQCGGSNPSIQGYFTQGIVPTGSVASSGNFGAMRIWLSG